MIKRVVNKHLHIVRNNLTYSSLYNPYGMVMPNRHGNADYRYGFQGQELDDEMKGNGNSVNYEFRLHDPRVGRFLSIDPLTKKYPHYSPYSFSGNKVIAWRELEGLEEFIAIDLNNGKYLLIWDISARKRPGEAGQIEFRTTSGEIIQKMRHLGKREVKYDWFINRLNAKSTDRNVTHHEDGTTISKKYDLPSTLLGNYGEMMHPEDVLDIQEPDIPTKENVPVIDSDDNTLDVIDDVHNNEPVPKQKYKYIVIYRDDACDCDDDSGGKPVALVSVPVNDGEVDYAKLRSRTAWKVKKMDKYRGSKGTNRVQNGSWRDYKFDSYEYKLLDGTFESKSEAWDAVYEQRNQGTRKGITRQGKFTGPVDN